MLIQLPQGHRPFAAVGVQPDDVLGEVAHQVAAGNPGGQAQALPGGVRLGNGQHDLKQMRRRIGGAQGVVVWLQGNNPSNNQVSR